MWISCLQYVDDTIMPLSPNIISIKRVKILIYIFELLSRLSIKFHKLSIYPLGPSSLDLFQVSALLYYRTWSFPFTYLRLSLSQADHPLQSGLADPPDRIDKDISYLEGSLSILWRQFSSSQSILTILSLYFISYFFLPQWMINYIDRWRRVFF